MQLYVALLGPYKLSEIESVLLEHLFFLKLILSKMDYFTRAYMRKANLKVKDEFHDRLTTGDIDHLRMARAYLVITPLTMMGLFHFMNRMR